MTAVETTEPAQARRNASRARDQEQPVGWVSAEGALPAGCRSFCCGELRRSAPNPPYGLSIENSTGKPDRPLYEDALAVERIRAARAAIDGIDPAVMLVARCEGFLTGERDLARTIARLTAFADAGADCLYAPGLSAPEDIAALVKAVAPKPVNVLIVQPSMTVQGLADLGVHRISVGGALARVAWGGFMGAAREIAERGTFSAFAGAAKGAELNGMFRGKYILFFWERTCATPTVPIRAARTD
jgi:hypothetical protein